MIEKKQLLVSLKTYSLREVPEGQEFTLSSGQKSRTYIDVKQTVMRGPYLSSLRHVLRTEMERWFPEAQAVAGVVLGGCHLATLVAPGLMLDVLYVRSAAKDHGTKSLIEGPSLGKGTAVVLFEDVVTTGGSMLKAYQVLRDHEYDVIGGIVVVDRRETPSDMLHGIPLTSLYTYTEGVGLQITQR